MYAAALSQACCDDNNLVLYKTGPSQIFSGEFFVRPENFMLELRACDERSVSATGVIATMLGIFPLSAYSAAYAGNNLSESHRTLGDNFSVTPCYESICSVDPSDVELCAVVTRDSPKLNDVGISISFISNTVVPSHRLTFICADCSD